MEQDSQQAKPSRVQPEHLLATVSQLSEEILGTLELEKVLETAVRHATQLLDVTSAYINQWDEQSGLVTVIAEHYQPEASEKERVSDLGTVYDITIDFGLPRDWLYTAGAYVIIHFDDIGIPPTEQAHLLKYDCKTAIEVILKAHGKPIGTLELWDSRQKRYFSEQDIELLKILSQQIALAIVNAQLYEQAQTANQRKSELIAKISHEFRTPLTALQGFAELFRTGLYGPLTARQEKRINSMLDSIRYLLKLVEQLLSQSELESKDLELHDAPFAVEEMVNAILPQLQLLAEQQGIQVKIQTETEFPTYLLGDVGRLQQIIVNLASNAVKFTPTGQVKVSLYLADVEQWIIEVQDTGLGITSEALTYIFEPFKQARETAKQNQRGSGLGLSIVKQIVDLMDGSIAVDSTVGKGSTFTVQLPLRRYDEVAT
ncbi:MAG: HAMP domain-containing sensor histidine kinase [Chloroflexota bacterium]